MLKDEAGQGLAQKIVSILASVQDVFVIYQQSGEGREFPEEGRFGKSIRMRLFGDDCCNRRR